MIHSLAIEAQEAAHTHGMQIECDREFVGDAGLLSLAYQGILRTRQVILSAVDSTVNGGIQ